MGLLFKNSFILHYIDFHSHSRTDNTLLQATHEETTDKQTDKQTKTNRQAIQHTQVYRWEIGGYGPHYIGPDLHHIGCQRTHGCTYFLYFFQEQ